MKEGSFLKVLRIYQRIQVVYICFILKGLIFHLLKNMLFTSVGVIIQKEDNIFVNGQKNMILMNQGQILSE
ncbi:hypothetical protein JN06_01966 [Bacteroides zoogleoformans]|nr:hypothetical protein JN06_01966 [Bacteroides zoogleoformans]